MKSNSVQERTAPLKQDLFCIDYWFYICIVLVAKRLAPYKQPGTQNCPKVLLPKELQPKSFTLHARQIFLMAKYRNWMFLRIFLSKWIVPPRFLQAHISPQKPECQLGSRTVKLTDEHNESSRSKSTALDSLGEDRPISLWRKKFAWHLHRSSGTMRQNHKEERLQGLMNLLGEKKKN